ncbi:hypothetical protein D0X99_16490 [Algoriphagus lacus]|uniref:Uncharacterized protein n=1 Tax=Algoriphagus lacus TaxID=2056311 RepID=A0A418PNA4_9BACT|nr:hypothetical protein [Algoriphagus lacus]RIW13372.1 hypothetical protein D0X99_16490 [Algoriphagus lacus]
MKTIIKIQKFKNLGMATLGSLFLMVLVVGLFSSCSEKKDEEPTGEFFVKGKISGQEILFSQSATSVREPRLFIGFAGNTPSSEYPSFSFGIEDVAIATGEFKETDPGIDMVFRYTLSGTEIYNSQIGTNPDFVITITSLSNNIAQGTFSGTLIRENNSNQSIVITEGSFRLPID